MSESETPDVSSATAAPLPATTAAAEQHTAFTGVLVGVGLALGGVVLLILTRVWLGAFSYSIATVSVMSWLALAAAVVELGLLLGQWMLWRRAVAAPADGPLPGVRASNRLHWLSYLATAVAVVAAIWAMAWIAYDQVGFWLLAAAALGLLVAHAAGGVQVVRRSGPAGTLRAHLQGFVARSNARADAEQDAAEAGPAAPREGPERPAGR